MNLNYEEVSIEEADRIIKTANLKLLATLIYLNNQQGALQLARSMLNI